MEKNNEWLWAHQQFVQLKHIIAYTEGVNFKKNLTSLNWTVFYAFERDRFHRCIAHKTGSLIRPIVQGNSSFSVKGPGNFASSSRSMLLNVDRDHEDYEGWGAQDGRLDFHTAPEQVSKRVALRPQKRGGLLGTGKAPELWCCEYIVSK